jgi:hypothetical protein
VILPAVPDWTALSEDERKAIKQKLIAALNSVGIKGATARWNNPAQLPHWQLIIQTSWCDWQSRNDVLRVRDQAMARADLQAPINGVILKSHKEK